MAGICDYLKWRGDLSLTERPFNDADNVILATFCYFDFTGIIPGPSPDPEVMPSTVLLSSACKQLLAKANGSLDKYVRSFSIIDNDFMHHMAVSRRFGTAKLHSYVDVVDDNRDLQFSAMQYDLDSDETYVAFRGTDNTLVGWREDFMLSFEVTEAQKEAQRYLEDALRLAQKRGRKVRVGGHSKGGNLAEYAAACCPADLRKSIICVYSNDGPCMAPEVMPVDSREVLGPKLKRLVPTYSVVGMIFSNPDDQRIIVGSSGIGIGQHDSATWKFTPRGMKEEPKLQIDCKVINDSIAEWARGLPLAERERMTNELFDALEVGGAQTFEDILMSKDGLKKVFKALNKADERTRKMVNALLSATLANSVGTVKKATQDAIEQWRKDAKVAANDALEQLGKNAMDAAEDALRKLVESVMEPSKDDT